MASLSTAVAYLLGILCLVNAFNNFFPAFRGADLIAGSILFGSAVVATAIRDRPERPDLISKPSFIPEDLRTEALDSRTD